MTTPRTYIDRTGTCSYCHVIIKIEAIECGIDANRFYWDLLITCPICSMRSVEMKEINP